MVDHPEDYILTAPMTTENGIAVNKYAIAAFHQVHCLVSAAFFGHSSRLQAYLLYPYQEWIFRAYLASTHGHTLPYGIEAQHVYQ